MAKIFKRGEKNRLHIESPFTRESMMDRDILAGTRAEEKELEMLPHIKIVSIGGGSIFDRGKKAIFPIKDELKELNKDHDLLVSCTAGVRGRHTYGIALDLGMPTGVLAHLMGSMEEVNALLLYDLLAKHGAVKVPRDDIGKLQSYYRGDCMVIVDAIPPYLYFDQPAKNSNVPMNGSDIGIWLWAEVLGAPGMVFVKDQKGLYDSDPKHNPNAKFIPKISVQELIELNLDNMIVDHLLPEVMLNARHAKEIQIVNGLEPGAMSRAVNGEHVGTIIYKDE